MIKKIVSSLLIVAMLFSGIMLSGCQKRRNDDNFLEIYVANFGYKHAWLEAIITEFKKQDWVKEKYPNLEIEFSKNSERNYAIDRIMSGKTNTIDLFFAVTSGTSKFEGSNGESFFENLQDVYDSTVPGESVKFSDKMNDNFLAMNTFEKKDGEKTFYSVPWVSGMQGMLYNKTAFDVYNKTASDENKWKEPRTTAELKKLSLSMVEAGEVPFIFSSKENYWSSMMFLLWWAQYEGNDNYTNFYNGFVEEDGIKNRSEDVFRQVGRLKSMEAIQDLIFNTNKPSLVHKDVNILEFAFAQSQFLLGNGLMMPNGDWFETEMRQTMTEDGITDEFSFMKTPVISSIVETLEDKSMSDETLGEIVGQIDNGEESSSLCSQNDFDKIYEARNLVLSLGNNTAMIPSYSSSKDLAKDFLRFMSTDIACNSFIRATNGASLPFDYDVKTKDKGLYESLPTLQKARLDMAETAIYMTNENAHKMVYYGGIARLSQTRTNIESLFTATNASDRMTARQIYDAEIQYWSKDKFALSLQNAGL